MKNILKVSLASVLFILAAVPARAEKLPYLKCDISYNTQKHTFNVSKNSFWDTTFMDKNGSGTSKKDSFLIDITDAGNRMIPNIVNSFSGYFKGYINVNVTFIYSGKEVIKGAKIEMAVVRKGHNTKYMQSNENYSFDATIPTDLVVTIDEGDQKEFNMTEATVSCRNVLE